LIRETAGISKSDPAKKEIYMTTLRAEFGKQRRVYHATRIEIRHLSDQLIRSAQSEEESIFLWTLICYFLQNMDAHQTPEMLTFQPNRLKREGYHAVLDTVSPHDAARFENAKDDGFGVLRWMQTNPMLKPLPVTVLTSSNLG